MIGKVVDGLRTSLGDSSSDTLNAMYVRANIESSLHRYAEAERAYRQVIALRAGTDSVTHHESLFPINGLALVLIETGRRSEEHTSELQSLMRNSYAVFCLNKKKITHLNHMPNNYITN